MAKAQSRNQGPDYDGLLAGISDLLEQARRMSARRSTALSLPLTGKSGGGSSSMSKAARSGRNMERYC